MIKNSEDPVVHFRTVGLSLTLQCNFSCGHCIAQSGPDIKECFSKSDADMLVQEVSKEASGVCFTGGESFLRKDVLCHCLRKASELGMIPTLVTNGYWANTESKSRETLEELHELGLKGICVSLDRFHLKFVKPENAFHIVKISKDLGISHEIRLCRTPRDRFADTILKDHHGQKINFKVARTLRLGRATGLPKTYFNYRSTPPKGRCGTVLSPLVLPNGEVQACCGPGMEHFTPDNPLILGNWHKETLSTILRRARSHYLIMAIANLGPLGLVDILRSYYGDDVKYRKRDKYTGICEICLDLCNDQEVVNKLQNAFRDEALQTKLVAGQVYIQSFDMMRRHGFLELPDTE